MRLLLACALAGTGALAAVKPKRGVVADGCKSTCADGNLLNQLGWHYAYNYPDPWTTAGAGFVPMAWCFSSVNETMPSYVNTSFFLGFNEPNNLHNCNKPAKDAAAEWAQVMRLFPDSQLVSPATAGDGRPWLDEFFATCKSLYGATGCNISYVAVHDYSCTASTTMAYLKEIHDRYGYKVWLTEFSCGDGAAGKPTKDHLAFMKDIVPQLDAADYVYRYAWMSAHSANRGLVDNGQLTELGTVYNTL